MKKGLLVLFSILLWTEFLAGQLYARETELSSGTRYCLDCHAKQGPVKKFQNGELISAYVNAGKFKASVHNFLECSGCHNDFSGEKHPERRFRSKRQYRIKTTRICRRCHNDESVRKRKVHDNLLKNEEKGCPLVCSDCHNPHTIMPVSGGILFATEEKYCMSCHEYELKVVFRNEETLLLRVDVSELDDSSHGNLSCSDCHFGFSSESHPKRKFKSKRDYILAASALCNRCHYDKYAKRTESIHNILLSKGNFNAPVCTDCHGSHSVSYVSEDRTLNAKKCKKCHNDIYEIYAGSVHGKALLQEYNTDVPICIDCHTVHKIMDPLATEYHEHIPDLCSKCHADKRIMGKYGLSTDVVKTYLSDFHGVTLSLYRIQKDDIYRPTKPIAVCTDCHGTHDITSTSGPDATVVKANLLKRCQKCHKEANENFPDAWLSHYMPTLSNAPLVFIVNAAYKILLPVMVIGLFLQILMHVWRYLVSR